MATEEPPPMQEVSLNPHDEDELFRSAVEVFLFILICYTYIYIYIIFE